MTAGRMDKRMDKKNGRQAVKLAAMAGEYVGLITPHCRYPA